MIRFGLCYKILAKIFISQKVNAVSHLWTTKAFLPSMIENDHGHICSIASSAGYFAVPKLAEYCASKAAAAHFADVSFKLLPASP